MCIYTCTLCDPVGCSPPGSSVHGISQARILHRWLLRFPGDLPDPGTELESPAMAGGFFTTEPPGRPSVSDPSLMKLSLRIAWRLGDITYGMSGIQSAVFVKY